MKVNKDITQGSDEWHAIRRGKMTASNAQAIGNNGKGLETYILDIMSELHSSAEKENYTNEDMERGHELEDQARQLYELQKGAKIEQVGFIEQDEHVGCSPDGLIGEDGGIETKCPKDREHFKIILYGKKAIESKYLWQVQMNLMITGRKWWDLVYYNPNFKNSLIIFRIEPDSVKHEKLKLGIEAGKIKIKEITNKLKNA